MEAVGMMLVNTFVFTGVATGSAGVWVGAQLTSSKHIIKILDLLFMDIFSFTHHGDLHPYWSCLLTFGSTGKTVPLDMTTNSKEDL